MSDKELAPISVEVVPVEDLENIRLVANADAGKENNVGIGERADAILGLAVRLRLYFCSIWFFGLA